MTTTPTTHYGFGKPAVGGSGGVWGDELNTALDEIDAALFTVQGLIQTAVNSGILLAAPVGSVIAHLATTTPPAGWVFGNSLTIGNTSSLAGNRANPDTEALFTFLWEKYPSNSQLQLFSSAGTPTARGVSAAADFAANCAIATPELRGEFARFADFGRGVDTGRAVGTYQAGQMPAHTHTFTIGNDPAGSVASDGSGSTGTATTGSTGGTSNSSENRPRNIALMGIIKL